jgi:hypothetical protein
VDDIAGYHLRRTIQDASQEFVRVKRLEGEEYVDGDDMHVYGPYPTPNLIEAMLSSEAMLSGEQAQNYLETDPDPQAFSHYLLNANFIAASAKPGLEALQRGAA